MKKNFLILLISLMILTASVCYSREINTKLMNKLIVIDVGHGGKDAGTSSNGILEKDINLSIALLLKEELIREGAEVILTRDGDYDISSPNTNRRKKSDFDNRIQFINESKADLYLSIHINYLEDKSVYGAQAFYTPGNQLLASVIQESFNSYLKSPLKVKPVPNSVYMYEKLEIPGVLIECGFLSNAAERKLLIDEEYQKKLSNAIVKALLQYY